MKTIQVDERHHKLAKIFCQWTGYKINHLTELALEEWVTRRGFIVDKIVPLKPRRNSHGTKCR